MSTETAEPTIDQLTDELMQEVFADLEVDPNTVDDDVKLGTIDLKDTPTLLGLAYMHERKFGLPGDTQGRLQNLFHTTNPDEIADMNIGDLRECFREGALAHAGDDS